MLNEGRGCFITKAENRKILCDLIKNFPLKDHDRYETEETKHLSVE